MYTERFGSKITLDPVLEAKWS